MTMAKQRRWMRTAIQTANETNTVLPWVRGKRRIRAAIKPVTTAAVARKA